MAIALTSCPESFLSSTSPAAATKLVPSFCSIFSHSGVTSVGGLFVAASSPTNAPATFPAPSILNIVNPSTTLGDIHKPQINMRLLECHQCIPQGLHIHHCLVIA